MILDHEDATAFWVEMGYRHDAEMGRFIKSVDP